MVTCLAPPVAPAPSAGGGARPRPPPLAAPPSTCPPPPAPPPVPRRAAGMERFSKFRDPGTGIQVFLPPVPAGQGVGAVVLAPFGWVLGVVRALLLVLVALVHLLLHQSVGQAHAALDRRMTRVSARAALLCLGYFSLRPEMASVHRKGPRALASLPPASAVQPAAGDLIVANYSSWIDVLILTAWWAPQFVVPVVAPTAGRGVSATASAASAGAGPTGAARRAAAKHGSASPSGAATESGVLGWRIVSWWEMLRSTGHVPSTSAPVGAGRMFPDAVAAAESLGKSGTPARDQTALVLFPELVTSNNRALLAPAPCFPISWRGFLRVQGHLRLGAGQPHLSLVGLKHAPPSPWTYSAVMSVPDETRSPLLHAWKICTSISPSRVVVARLLAPDECPTSEGFSLATVLGSEGAREIVSNAPTSPSRDAVAETCMSLLSSIARLRRTRLSWQDKQAFLDMYRR